MTNIAQNTS